MAGLYVPKATPLDWDLKIKNPCLCVFKFNMVARRVLLHIFQRRKRIVLEEDTGRPDVELLHEEFKKICEQDAWISKQVGMSEIVFQQYDPTFEVNVDIDNDTVIEDKTQVYVVILSVINDCGNPVNKPVIANGQNCDQSGSNLNGSSLETVESIISEADPHHPEVTANINTCTSNANNTPCRKSVVPYPSPLPKFSTEIEERHKRGEFLTVYGRFVRECAFFLLSLTARPSKTDYKHFCRTVGEEYPRIKVSFNLQLTRCVRNIRQRQKTFSKCRFQSTKKKISARKISYVSMGNASNSASSLANSNHTEEHETQRQSCAKNAVHVSNERYDLRRTKGANKCYSQVKAVPYPSPLPKFSSQIEYRHERGELLVEYRRFVRECAIFLLSLTATPSKTDYRNFCRTVGEEYPIVKDCNDMLVSFNLQLTKCVRNLRQRQKSYMTRSPKKRNSISARRSIFHCSSGGDASNTMSAAETSRLEVLKMELKQCALNTVQPYSPADEKRISSLLNETFELRRQEVKDVLTCGEILESYPQLKEYSWFLQEANKVLVTPVEHRELRFQLIMARLQELSQLEEPENPNYCDEHHFRLLLWLGKKLKPNEDSLPIVLHKATEPMDVTCSPTSSPFAKVYTDEDGKINAAFILGQGIVIVDLVDKTNAFEVVDALMSTYYVYNRIYPAGYRDFLKFLQQEFLGLMLSRKEMVNASKLTTFLKMYNTT